MFLEVNNGAMLFKVVIDSAVNLSELYSNNTFFNASLIACKSVQGSTISGQPLFSTVPNSSGHSSKASHTPSPSVSGQPLHPGIDEATPGVSGQSSSASRIPSPSLSKIGQPLFSIGPASSGHSSIASHNPSPSVSGQPWQPGMSEGKPATSGQSSSSSNIPSPSLSLLPKRNVTPTVCWKKSK